MVTVSELTSKTDVVQKPSNLFFLKKNEVIFVQLDELDELDRITHAWIRINLQSGTSTDS